MPVKCINSSSNAVFVLYQQFCYFQCLGFNLWEIKSCDLSNYYNSCHHEHMFRRKDDIEWRCKYTGSLICTYVIHTLLHISTRYSTFLSFFVLFFLLLLIRNRNSIEAEKVTTVNLVNLIEKQSANGSKLKLLEKLVNQ